MFVNLAPSTPGPMRTFYQFVEFGAERLANLYLSGKYRRIHVVKGADATLGNFVGRLNAVASTRGLMALDCIFVTHGLTGRLAFADGTATIENVRDTIRTVIPASRRARFRMMFSTACYGASHRRG